MRKPAESRHQCSRSKTGSGSAHGADDQECDGIGQTSNASIAGSIGAHAKDRGMPEGSNPAISGDQIERQDQKREADQSRQEREVVRKQHEANGADQRDRNQRQDILGYCRRRRALNADR